MPLASRYSSGGEQGVLPEEEEKGAPFEYEEKGIVKRSNSLSQTHYRSPLFSLSCQGLFFSHFKSPLPLNMPTLNIITNGN